MRKIATVAHTNGVPHEVLAQTVAGAANWHRDEAGAIYDQREIYVANSLTEAAAAFQHLGWISGPRARHSGVNGRRIDAAVREEYDLPQGDVPPKDYWADLAFATPCARFVRHTRTRSRAGSHDIAHASSGSAGLHGPTSPQVASGGKTQHVRPRDKPGSAASSRLVRA